MCRSTEIQGFFQKEGDRLKIRSFYLRLSISIAHKSIPESLTLLYLPRVNGNPLEINESKIRSDSAAFVTLHRVRSAEKMNNERVGEAVFASREQVRASEGVRFEVYLREEKVLKGIFMKNEYGEWKMECKCALESVLVGFEVAAAEVCVAVEGQVAMNERVDMVVKRRKKKKIGFQGLEEIPEEREVETESENCCCSCGDLEMGSDGGDYEENGDEYKEIEIEMEGVRWAFDVGIWVMCLGVGYLVSKASSRTLRLKRIL
ncbi:hypothetical protein HHK36_027422 [Tetracentron sinense]|uniref:Uncharacterized protein n=1 Tax=Tetracentron sinense TaxID=13715 RepID=A0A834YD77_TETSI|nr:hypothetical protein HHK36_027422 [Tetracentron sinense]